MFRMVQRSFLLVSLLALGAFALPAQVGRSLGVIDPNFAEARDLLSVSGLSPEVVKAILDARPFMSMGEFDAFLGRTLDRDQRSMLYLRLFLPINVNATSDEELRLVPGMGAHLLVNFKENRPFNSLASLSQEIGKYLPSKDAARLAQYVFVPLDINTATDDDLRTIPGMTAKLLATIKQHRPYQDLAAFTKAIRRVASARESTRLSSFVRITAAP